MTQEQKAAVERAADNINETLSVYASYYGHIVAGMTYVIDNPDEFGLVDAIKAQHSVCDVLSKNEKLATEVTHMHYQLAKYREALKRILQGNCSPTMVAKEALKQEDTTCPKCGYPLFKHLGKACCQGCDYVKQQ